MLNKDIFSRQQGFTLFEILTAFTVMAITFLIIATMAFTGKQQTVLIAESEKLKTAIEYARQQSLAAYRGQEYSIQITPPHEFNIMPENNPRTIKAQITQPQLQQEIIFEKITGRTDKTYLFTLEYGNLHTTIEITPEGTITKSDITTK